MLQLAAALAACAPALLAFNLPPSATMLNQCVAVAVWGGWVLVIGPGWRSAGALTLLGALLALAAGVAVSWGAGALPSSLGLAAIGSLAAAAVLVQAGAVAARRSDGVTLFAAFATGLLAAGVLSALVALVQVFAPEWTDGTVIAHSGLPGRAVGNLRQPNHLCSLLLWAVIANVALVELQLLPRRAGWALLVLLVFAVELTASRTGAAGLLLLAAWALLDRRLSRTGRAMLLATLLLYALSYAAMAGYGHWSHQALGAEARLASEAGGGPSPNSRLNIWRNALALIAQQPWTGVGFGEFNLAWTLTAFPGRPTAFFDHTHNLELQLAVELGLPLAALVLGLLAWALMQAWRRTARLEGEAGAAGRAALLLVLMIGLHSQVEYPLWYTYFLLPAAFAWGLALGAADPATAGKTQPGGPLPAVPQTAGVLAGLVLVLGGAAAVLDYQRVVVIYAPDDNAGPLAARIAAGQRSPLFAHHADYAATTSDALPASRALGFARAPHQLLDTRLMIAWARWFDAHQQPVLASTLVQRLAEFRNKDAEDFFADCQAADAMRHFQCRAALPPAPWRAFLAPVGD
jgi:O-antigen ligase